MKPVVAVTDTGESLTAEQLALKAAEARFVDAFNSCRSTLAAFARCSSEADLHCVRDGFFLALAAKLMPDQYEPIKISIIENEAVALAAGTAGSFQAQIAAARMAPGWDDLVIRVKATALTVGSDLDTIWQKLETGRTQWITAIKATHQLKLGLKEALAADGGGEESDILECKMLWIYSLGTMIPNCKELAARWATCCGMEKPEQPLVGFDSAKWDARRNEWAPLDLGVQAAAEAGGTSLDDAWNL